MVRDTVNAGQQQGVHEREAASILGYARQGHRTPAKLIERKHALENCRVRNGPMDVVGMRPAREQRLAHAMLVATAGSLGDSEAAKRVACGFEGIARDEQIRVAARPQFRGAVDLISERASLED